MAGETVITVVGNLTAEPELKFTANGAAVANFTVASTPRTFDRQAGEFKEGETLFLRCSAWREMAENVADSLTRGSRVIVQGRLRSRSFDTKEGERRTVMELDVDEIGPSLRFASANVTKNERGQGGQGAPRQQRNDYAGGRQQGGQNSGGWGGSSRPQGGAPAQQADPWASSNPQNGGWGNPGTEEPPF